LFLEGSSYYYFNTAFSREFRGLFKKVIMHSTVFSVLLAAPLCLGLPGASNRARSYGSLELELPDELASTWYQPYDARSNNTPPSNPGAVYSCAGPDIDDYPKPDQWLSFDALWAINEPLIKEKNKGNNYGDYIKRAIESVSTESKIDARLILVIIMQEASNRLRR
jgi:hypothetical protein